LGSSLGFSAADRADAGVAQSAHLGVLELLFDAGRELAVVLPHHSLYGQRYFVYATAVAVNTSNFVAVSHAIFAWTLMRFHRRFILRV
jgi:hypothetical protein